MSEKLIKTWTNYDNPPSGKPGLWTRPVIVFTNRLNLYSNICYMHGTLRKEDGHWQNPSYFEKGEKVKSWIDYPEI